MYEIVLISYLFTNQNEHLFVLPQEQQRKKQMNYNLIKYLETEISYHYYIFGN